MNPIVLLAIHLGYAGIANGFNIRCKLTKKKYHEQTNLKIETFDSKKIAAQIYVPKQYCFPGLRPAIIFANSWTRPESQYEAQAKKFANKGYLVLGYATRGFGNSEGQASGAGPNDIKDVSTIIDWLEANTLVDPERVGMTGVSYGGGISLMALANDERIATATSLSSWTNLKKSFYENDTVRKVFLKILISTGELTGSIDPELKEVYRRLRNHDRVEGALSWAKIRSPIEVIDKINQRNTPVLLANNYRDYLFPPAQNLDFFKGLTTPKRFIVSNGIHASAEFPGFYGFDIGVWQDIHRWYDHWFLDIENGIIAEPPIALNTPDGLELYDTMPPAKANSDMFSLEPINQVETDGEWSARSGISIKSSYLSGATNGIPLVSSLLHSHTPIKIVAWLNALNRKHKAIYYTRELSEMVQIRGIPRVRIPIEPKDESMQIIAYLYEVNRFGLGTLLTHGVATFRGLTPGKAFNYELKLAATANNINKSNRIAVVIDTTDPLYGDTKVKDFAFKIIHDNEDSLEILIPEAP